MKWTRTFVAQIVLAVSMVPAAAQTTQGVVLGRIVDSVTARPIAASVACTSEATGQVFRAHASPSGDYTVSSLSPGRYRIDVTALTYQSQQARALEIPVAARVEMNFRMRPLSDVWEARQYRSVLLPGSQQSIGFYGPDVDTTRNLVFNANRGFITPLDNSRSDVISATNIDNLPLLGRDVYTMLVLLPGVTSDTSTGRGLGFSVNGQRPSASNYLLDGAENNNLLVTGPLSAAVPEFIQEYRISTSNFSAEYGRTSGFLANAVTRSGGNQWHGRGYFYFENDRLNANGFQENASAIHRPPFTEIQPGAFVSGPIVRKRWFVSAGFQEVRAHGRGDPQVYALPAAGFINSSDPSSYAGKLLRTYLPEASASGSGPAGLVSIAPVSAFNRLDGLLRLDGVLSSSHRFFARAAIDRLDEPGIDFNPYRAFSRDFQQRSFSVAAGVNSRLSPVLENEFRISRTGDANFLETPHSEIPALIDDESLPASGNVRYSVVLPGNGNPFDYRNRSRNWEVLDNLSWIHHRHAFKAGAGMLQRNTSLSISVFPRGYLEFNNLSDFVNNQPSFLTAEYDRLSATRDPVSPLRSYRYRQAFAFAQDSFQATSKLTLDYGVRYEFFGSPVNTGDQKDLLIQLGSGTNIQSSIRSAQTVLASGSNAPVYSSQPQNWAVRAAFAYKLRRNGSTLLRGSYGIFYDRLFDNLWENVIQNRYTTGIWKFNAPVPPTASLSQLISLGQYQTSSELIPYLAFQPSIKTPRVHSAFLGVQQGIRRGITAEIDALASKGTQLITTDQINRAGSVAPTVANPFGYLNPDLNSFINYRANQGSSQFTALAATMRFRMTRVQGQVSYTWSHSIDNQSEPLDGTFFDFNATGSRTAPGTSISSFTRQFASSLDRGNSDFDQRHNLVFYLNFQPPAIASERRIARLARGWTFSALGAVRSGLPFTVNSIADYTAAVPEIFVNQRANLDQPASVSESQPVAGGKRILNPQAFSLPGPNVIGTSGRNAFGGPAFFNVDASVARTFAITERLRLSARADFYNALNHANLNNPSSFLGTPDFGVALYGRRESNSGFPLLTPLAETSRQIQLLFRLEF